MKISTRGFATLIAVVLMTAVLSSAFLTLSALTYFEHASESEAVQKIESRNNALECARSALIKIAHYPNALIALDGECGDSCSHTSSCKICTISYGAATHIVTRGKYMSSYTNLAVTVQSASLSVISATEIPIYSGPACDLP